jgi:hypothetical protein
LLICFGASPHGRPPPDLPPPRQCRDPPASASHHVPPPRAASCLCLRPAPARCTGGKAVKGEAEVDGATFSWLCLPSGSPLRFHRLHPRNRRAPHRRVETEPELLLEPTKQDLNLHQRYDHSHHGRSALDEVCRFAKVLTPVTAGVCDGNLVIRGEQKGMRKREAWLSQASVQPRKLPSELSAVQASSHHGAPSYTTDGMDCYTNTPPPAKK